MIEIHPHLFIGDQADYELTVRHQPGWRVVHACKEPYHRQALGYRTRSAPRDHPEYLIARRPARLILNLVDADDPAYIPTEIIHAALDFIHQGLLASTPVLVHCNQGHSRSAGIGLLYLAAHTDRLPTSDLAAATAAYKLIYPPYAPAPGIRAFIQANWNLGFRGTEDCRLKTDD